MSKKTIAHGTDIKKVKGTRPISIVSFSHSEGWDLVEYDNAGESRFKIAEIPPSIPLDRMTPGDQQKLILSILEVYDDRIENMSLGIAAKWLTKDEVFKIHNKTSVSVPRHSMS